MKFEDFIIKVQEKMQDYVGNEAKIEIREVNKNNGIKLQGIVIVRENTNVSPTIYLESFYDMYQRGMIMDEILIRLIKLYDKETPKNQLDLNFFNDFECVKNNIVYKLINQKRNEQLLEDIPHIEFLDLAICFYYSLQMEELGEGMILIHNAHMDMWNTNHKELMLLAQKNTPYLFPVEFKNLESIIKEYVETDTDRIELVHHDVVENMETTLFVLSNQKKVQGAATILYPEVLEKIGNYLKKDFYILPSSIHEVIILRDEETIEKYSLQEMVASINKEQVEPEEILSDYPYFYDLKKKKIDMIF